MKRYSLRLNLLSPVHIGCGTDFDPLGYVIDGRKNELCSFNPEQLAAVLEPYEFDRLEEITNLPGSSGLNEMRRFIGQFVDRIKDQSTHRVQVVPGISAEYSDAVNGDRRAGRLEIARTFYNPYSNNPIIPGSSIKGAIRTAVLSCLNKGNEQPDKQSYDMDLMGGNFARDPFRLIKIGDANHKSGDERHLSKIVYVVNKYRANDGDLSPGKGITVRMETIADTFDGGCHFIATLNLTKLGNIDGKTPDRDKHWGFTDLARMCNDFYLPKLEKDLRTLEHSNSGWVNSIRKSILGQENVAVRLEKNTAFILRVGHHSGAESVTMDGARSIYIRRGRGHGSHEKQATTQWFTADRRDGSSGLLPFGWLLVIISGLL